MLIVITTINNPKNAFADDIKKFASKLFNHYGYNDKITNYLKSIFSSSSDGFKNNTQKKKIIYKITPLSYLEVGKNNFLFGINFDF